CSRARAAAATATRSCSPRARRRSTCSTRPTSRARTSPLAVLLFLCLLRAQIAKARFHGRQLIEIAVPALLRELELLDRCRQRSLKIVVFGQCLVVQQALARSGVGLGLQGVQLGVARVALDEVTEPCDRSLLLPRFLQGF